MIGLNKINQITTIIFLVLIMTIPRSFIMVKLGFLSLFILTNFFTAYEFKRFKVYPLTLLFYVSVSIAGLFWSLVGFLNDGAYQGIIDGFRLWFFWSIAYALIITFLNQGDKIEVLHYSLVLSGIIVSIINFLGVLDFYYQTGIIPEAILSEMDLRIGFHEGYVQITSHNIAALLFIVPYLITLQFRKDTKKFNSGLTKISLILCLILTILSGRRALWLCVILTPVFILGFAFFTDSIFLLKRKFKILLFSMIFIGLAALSLLFVLLNDSLEIPTLEHITAAFSAEDERSIQKGYLVDSFKRQPIFGSGFGGHAGYIRSEREPWLYELTYYQLLFNFGVLGVIYLFLIFVVYLYIIISALKKIKAGTALSFSIMIGFFSFLLGAYSNPYFMSFDFLIYISMLPFIATYNTYIPGYVAGKL